MSFLDQVKGNVLYLNAEFPGTITDVCLIANHHYDGTDLWHGGVMQHRVVWYDTECALNAMVELTNEGVKLWHDINPWDMGDAEDDYKLWNNIDAIFKMRRDELRE